MPRYIIDTDKIAAELKGKNTDFCKSFLLQVIKMLHEGKGNYDFATRIKKETKPTGGYTDAFEEFWKAYPKKIGKGAAFKVWKRIKDEDRLLAACLKAIKWQQRTDQWAKDEGQFIPHPTTYLNQERWEDECPPELRGDAPAKRTYRDMDGILRED